MSLKIFVICIRCLSCGRGTLIHHGVCLSARMGEMECKANTVKQGRLYVHVPQHSSAKIYGTGRAAWKKPEEHKHKAFNWTAFSALSEVPLLTVRLAGSKDFLQALTLACSCTREAQGGSAQGRQCCRERRNQMSHPVHVKAKGVTTGAKQMEKLHHSSGKHWVFVVKTC